MCDAAALGGKASREEGLVVIRGCPGACTLCLHDALELNLFPEMSDL